MTIQQFFVERGDNLCKSCFKNIAASINRRLELGVEQQRFSKHVEENIKLNDTNYFVTKLSLKNFELKLSKNKEQALQRMQGLRKKLR